MKYAAFQSPWEGPPRLNHPSVYGASPNKPFLYKLPCAGQRPMTFSVDRPLPQGLCLDRVSGVISGICPIETDEQFLISAENSLGRCEKKLRLLIRPDGILRTPLMGFTSWNAFGGNVSQADIRKTADGIARIGLNCFGYSYVNIDSGWQGHYDERSRAIAPNERFPDMPGLVAHIHALGLKAGIYSTPMQKAWGGEDLPGCTRGYLDPRYADTPYGIAKDHRERENAAQWAAWGIDYLKYDWRPCDTENAEKMKQALLAAGRDFGFCVTVNAGYSDVEYWKTHCSSWRDNADSRADWINVRDNRFSADKWALVSAPGHFFDLDMLETGKQTTRHAAGCLTEDEQFLTYTIRAVFPSPLQISCDVGTLTDRDLALLCNEEVIAVNQDALGKGAVCIDEHVTRDASGNIRLWTKVYAKELENGSRAIALFNLGEEQSALNFDAADCLVRDLWAKENISQGGRISVTLDKHSARLFKLSARTGT